jgi:hypothetical protein
MRFGGTPDLHSRGAMSPTLSPGACNGSPTCPYRAVYRGVCEFHRKQRERDEAPHEVYRARDARLGRDVAIKVIPAFVIQNRTRRQTAAPKRRKSDQSTCHGCEPLVVPVHVPLPNRDPRLSASSASLTNVLSHVLPRRHTRFGFLGRDEGGALREDDRKSDAVPRCLPGTAG